ncbi:putative GMP synthase [Daphnia magna]|uniref:Putative GMP synthase n=1 Tax=Daphnia magna TaxID=35525 RepID=A0A164JBQ3_9CRUS|nr:putative GMP synthase [Daphnia magna]
MFVGRAPKSSGSFYYRTCYGNPFGFDSAVCAALFHKALLQSDDLSRVHDIHINNGFLRKDESEQVVTSLQQLGLNLRTMASHFYCHTSDQI